MDNMSSKEENIIAKEQNQMIGYRAVNNCWINSVIKEKRFEATYVTDKGIVKAELGVKLPKSAEEITVTVWKQDYIRNRLHPWMNFQHRNVMPLLYTESISNLNAVLIYSISPDSTLQHNVNSKEFRCDNNALKTLVLYLIEATQGLSYLHEQGHAHLNIKSSSIAILKDGTIKLDQLHFISPVRSNSTRNGLPQPLNPPETFYEKENGHKYPQKFDSWSVGIMILELFTGGYLSKKLPKCVHSWCIEVYPILYKVLKKKKFDKHFHQNFSGVSSRIDLKAIRYLIMNILTLHPNYRPTIEDIHNSLSNLIMEKKPEGIAMYSAKPKIWKRKMHWIELVRETARVTLEAKEELNTKLIKVDERALKRVKKTEPLTKKITRQSNEHLTHDYYSALREEVLECFGGKMPKVLSPEDTDDSKIHVPRETKIRNLRDEEFKTEEESTDYTVLDDGINTKFPKDLSPEDTDDSKIHVPRETKIRNLRDEEFTIEEESTDYTVLDDGINSDGKSSDDTIRENTECLKVYESCGTEKKDLKDEEFSEEESDECTTSNEEENKKRNACHGNIFSKLFSFGNTTFKYFSDPWNPVNPNTYMNKLSKKLTR